jgi:uncharacterized membrane protein required for colicin V production
VGIVMAAIILTVANMVQSVVVHITSGSSTNQEVDKMIVALIIGFVNLAIGLVAAIVSVWIAIRVLDSIGTDIEETNKLAKGNVAVAIVMAGVLIAVSFVIGSAVSDISNALNPSTLGL